MASCNSWQYLVTILAKIFPRSWQDLAKILLRYPWRVDPGNENIKEFFFEKPSLESLVYRIVYLFVLRKSASWVTKEPVWSSSKSRNKFFYSSESTWPLMTVIIKNDTVRLIPCVRSTLIGWNPASKIVVDSVLSYCRSTLHRCNSVLEEFSFQLHLLAGGF